MPLKKYNILIPFFCAHSLLAYDVITVGAEVHENHLSQTGLDFKLTNNSTEKIELFPGALPWGSNTSVTLTVIEPAPSLASLSPARAIEDPAIGIIDLLPRKTLGGSIDLNNYFLGFNEAHKSSDLILFWTFELVTTSGKKFPRNGGWIFLHKRTLAVAK